MKIVIIGAGNLAVHLSQALQNAGYDIIQVYSRSEGSAAYLAGLLKTDYVMDIALINGDADLYIIAVSDDAIPSVIDQLPVSDQLVVHTAGSVSIDIFSGKIKNYGVVYPLQTFSKSRPVDFSVIPVFIEANTPGNTDWLKRVAGKISQKVYLAGSQERVLLHLAAVFGCNFVNYLYGISAGIVEQSGFDFNILAPLLIETAHKAIDSGDPRKVQTGPAVRNDRMVMQKHSELLNAYPALQEIYHLLNRSIRTN